MKTVKIGHMHYTTVRALVERLCDDKGVDHVLVTIANWCDAHPNPRHKQVADSIDALECATRIAGPPVA